MQITIYMDVIFLINFIADFTVLYLTGVITKKKIQLWRVAIGALFGAVIILLFILYPALLVGWKGIVISVGISMGAVAIPYGEKSVFFIRTWFLSTTIMVLIGGIMNYLKYIFHFSVLQALPWLVLFGGSCTCIALWIAGIKQAFQQKENIFLIRLQHGERVAVEKVYLDTGNRLKDPLFQKPVIVLSESIVCQVLSDEERQIVKQYQVNGTIHYEDFSLLSIQRGICFHEISFQSVGNLSGKMLCVLIDEVCILGEEKVLHRQPVALASEMLFVGRSYKGLLHRGCV